MQKVNYEIILQSALKNNTPNEKVMEKNFF